LIVLDLRGRVHRTPSPFKFFEGWLQDLEYQALVHKLWIPIGQYLDTHVVVHFLENLKRIKHETITLAHEKKLKEEQELKLIEQSLLDWQDGNGMGFFSRVDKEDLVRLEHRKRALLTDKEASWRLKSCVIWLTFGDENTKLFHSYSKGRKMKTLFGVLNRMMVKLPIPLKSYLHWAFHILNIFSRHRREPPLLKLLKLPGYSLILLRRKSVCP
jgi:hypothetical protein